MLLARRLPMGEPTDVPEQSPISGPEAPETSVASDESPTPGPVEVAKLVARVKATFVADRRKAMRIVWRGEK